MDTVVPAAVAAMSVDILIYPLDTIKSRVQAADFAERFPNRQGLYRGLWQGFGPVVLATLPSAAIFFTTYEHAKATFASESTPYIGHILARDPRAMAVAHGSCSAMAELAACLLLTPAETIKQQLQVARPGYQENKAGGAGKAGLAAKAASIPRPSLSSLWRGYVALAGRNLPFTAMQFPLYEYFRGHISRAVDLPERRVAGQPRAGHQEAPMRVDDVSSGEPARERAYNVQRQTATVLQTPEGTLRNAMASMPPAPSTHHYSKAGLVSASSAALAGAISALVTTPLDLIKTRIMLGSVNDDPRGHSSHGSEAGKASSRPARSAQTVLAVGADVWRREGLRGLMRGGVLRGSWTAMGAAIYLGSYEAGREWWNTAGHLEAQEAANAASVAVDGLKQQVKREE